MINVNIKSSSRYPIRRKEIKATIADVLQKMNVFEEVEVDIEIVGDRKMTQLHLEFMNEPGTTDVLSFPLHENYIFNRDKINNKKEFVDLPDKKLRLGSIIVSYPQARKQANDHNLMVDQEIVRLVEHGMLHLLGIHHE